MKKYALPIGIGLLSFIFGFFLHGVAYQPVGNSRTTETRVPGKYKYINPLLECDNSSISQDTNLNLLQQKIDADIRLDENDGDPNYTSVYYRDMNNGPWFSIHANELFSPASLIKVPLMIAYLKKADSDPTVLQNELLNTTVYNPSTQNIQPQVTLAPNQKYTVQQLIEQMIKYSDDVSYELLNEQLPLPEIISVYNDLGVDISKGFSDPAGNIVSVKDYASFYRILFNGSYLSPKMSEYALHVLSQTQFNQGLVAGLPSNTTVSHKFGERQYLSTGLKQLHDCGIIYLPKKPYLLCIMTRGKDFSNLEKNIQRISKTVYNYIQNEN